MFETQPVMLSQAHIRAGRGGTLTRRSASRAPSIHKWLAEDFAVTSDTNPPPSVPSRSTILSTPAPQTSRTELLRLIRGGEDTFLELKVKLSNTEKIAQEIVALANTGGGVIVFGVNDQLRIEGVDDPESVQEELVTNLPRRYRTRHWFLSSIA